MKKLSIGDVSITSIIERDGPWRTPREMFPAYDPIIGKHHIAELDSEVFDPASGRMVITYQTYIVRTPRYTVLIDTCTGEDKGHPPPMDFPKQPWLDGFAAAGLRFEDIDYVFCTHLHIDHCGWNTVLRNGRWVPTFPKAKYIFHKSEYAAWEESTKRGETRAGGVAMCFTTIASRSSKLARRCLSTTAISSTIRFGSSRRPATLPTIAASISARADSRPS
jgi:glyoxylase-like metal-dependent hydrolase (beta-lactamase superfamily II)